MNKKLLYLIIVAFAFTYCGKDSPYIYLPEEENIIDTLINDSIITHNFLSIQPNLPKQVFKYVLDDLPAHFINSPLDFFDSEPSSNILSNEGATLGRVLFYDKRLSINNTIACANCHHQEFAFADNAAFSTGIHKTKTTRNSMSLTNLKWNFLFFWDERVFGLENQVLQPIEDENEMGIDLEMVIEKLDTTTFYSTLFYDAFGDSTISKTRIAQAISQFVRSMASYKSKYDQGLQNNFIDFTAEELNGKSLFFNSDLNCNQCHQTAIFSRGNASNTGFSLDYEDKGKGGVNGNDASMDVFKVPTLRNIEFTAPYMHDGRFETLEEVIEHYDHKVQPHRNLGDQLTENNQIGGTPKVHNLSEQSKQDLIAFLKTLTDYELVSDEKFANPFVE